MNDYTINMMVDDEHALTDLIDHIDTVIEEIDNDDYTRAMRRQRDWLVRRRDEVRANLAQSREGAIRQLTP